MIAGHRARQILELALRIPRMHVDAAADVDQAGGKDRRESEKDQKEQAEAKANARQRARTLPPENHGRLTTGANIQTSAFNRKSMKNGL